MIKNVSVFEFRTGVDFLQAVYKSIAAANPRFSLRSFAHKIDIDQSTLVRYFSKDRLLSSEKTDAIARHLKLNKIETHYFKLLTTFGDRGEMDILEKLRTGFLFEEYSDRLNQPEGAPFLENIELTMDLKAHLILICQQMTQDLQMTDIAKMLSRFFATDEKQVSEIIHKLVEVGFLDADKKRRKELLQKVFIRTEDLPRDVGLLFHSDALRVGANALKNFDTSDVEIYTSLIALKKEGRGPVLEAIKHLHSVISQYNATEEADDIFLVSAFMVNMTSEDSPK